MTISIKSPTSTTGSIQKNGSDVITIDASDNVTVANDLTATSFIGNGSSLTGLPAGYTDSDALSLFNASGSAPVYACRAWVNFNGTGTVAIRASGNVSSITDNGTGDYRVNFTTAMPDVNYSVGGLSQLSASTNNCDGAINIKRGFSSVLQTTSVRIGTGSYNLSLVDNLINCVQVFR